MEPYPKIQTVFKRDLRQRRRPLIVGEWATPEIAYLVDAQWQWTEKVDGTNARIMIRDDKVQFGGRSEQAELPPALVVHLYEHFTARIGTVKGLFDGTPVCLYGEGYGGCIQNRGVPYSPDQRFILFDVLVGDSWLRRESVEAVAADLELDVVPVVGQGTLHEAIALAKFGFYSHVSSVERKAEGIVCRPMVELRSRTGKRIITKVKARDFDKEADE